MRYVLEFVNDLHQRSPFQAGYDCEELLRKARVLNDRAYRRGFRIEKLPACGHEVFAWAHDMEDAPPDEVGRLRIRIDRFCHAGLETGD